MELGTSGDFKMERSNEGVQVGLLVESVNHDTLRLAISPSQ